MLALKAAGKRFLHRRPTIRGQSPPTPDSLGSVHHLLVPTLNGLGPMAGRNGDWCLVKKIERERGASIEESGGSVFYDFCSLVEGGGLGELGPPKLFDSIVNV